MNKQLFGFYNLNLGFFECLLSGALDQALSACERAERHCIKAVGQDKMQDGRRERSWGLQLTELDREWFYVLLKLSMGWGIGEGERVRNVYLANEPENISERQNEERRQHKSCGCEKLSPWQEV